MQNPLEKQIIELIHRSNKILIMPSSPPDGDSIGSAIALYMVLKKLKKDATIVCSDPVPDSLHFLPNIQMIINKMVSSNDFIITIDLKDLEIDSIKSLKEDNKLNIVVTPKNGSVHEDDITFNKGKTDIDLIITVDTAELTQLRGFYENNTELFLNVPVINIDHHISNTHFGKINHVDIMASSSTELIVPLVEQLEAESGKTIFDEDIATLLLTGIITDTGSFQNANTTPKSFDVAAKLIAYGARQQEIIQHIYKTKQLSQLKLWGRVLSKIQTDEQYRLVWSVLSRQDFKDTLSSEEETGDIIDELMTNAPGAEIVFLIKEKENGLISVSLRTTTPQINASKIAENFDGGGHTQAAGFRMENMDLREAEYEIIKYLKEYQKKRLGIIDNMENKSKPVTKPEEIIQKAKELNNKKRKEIPIETVKKKSENSAGPEESGHGTYKFGE